MELIEERRRILLNTPHIETILTNAFKTDMVAPFKKLEVRFEPVQDLHGYNSPWPAGGGVNKWDEQLEYGRINLTSGAPTADKNYKRSVNFCACLPQTSYYGKAPQNPSTFALAFYDANKSYLGYLATAAVRNTVFTTPENAYFFKLYASGDRTSEIAINYPSTVTTYAPYSNICPISGWTGVQVARTGVNIWDEEWEVGGFDDNGEPNYDTQRIRTKNYIFVKPNTTYCFFNRLKLFEYNANKEYVGNTGFIGGNNPAPKASTFTTGSNTYYLKFITTTSYPTTYGNDLFMNYPSTDTTYHPYSGTTYPISWQTEAGTVYGGNLDVTTGLLTVDRVSITFDGSNDEGWRKDTTYNYFTRAKISGAIDENAKANNFKSNLFAYGNIANGNSITGACLIWGGIRVRLPDMSLSLAEWNTFLSNNPLQVIYPLATPQTYQLTPQQILTLKNNNTLMSEGSINELKYWTHI